MINTKKEYFPLNQITDCDLSVEQAFLLRENAGAVSNFRDFNAAISKDQNSEQYALGLATKQYRLFTRNLGLKDWIQAYDDTQSDIGATKTEDFMSVLTQRDASVYFFVPSKLFTHKNAKMTKGEMEWCLNNPRNISRVNFVFGFYSLVGSLAQAKYYHWWEHFI